MTSRVVTFSDHRNHHKIIENSIFLTRFRQKIISQKILGRKLLYDRFGHKSPKDVVGQPKTWTTKAFHTFSIETVGTSKIENYNNILFKFLTETVENLEIYLTNQSL